MKKTYQHPDIQMTRLAASHHLLAGSGSTGDTIWESAFGGDAGEGEEGASRGGSVWDEEY